ncbi:MAG TPA: hypothetical protein VD997_07460 [Phycisphaerales bacterium]|nr:hypothetical protein [Phycisphaerales bacterium]
MRPLAVVSLLVTGAAMAQPVAPAAFVPRGLARALTEGDTRVVVVGDSLSVNTMGDVGGLGHTPLAAGMQRVWRPRAWRGVYCPAPGFVPGGLELTRGVGSSAYDHADSEERVLHMALEEEWPGGVKGFATENAVEWRLHAGADAGAARADFRLFPLAHAGGTRASQQLLASQRLRARAVVYAGPDAVERVGVRVSSGRGFSVEGALSEVDKQRAGWTWMDFEVGSLLRAPFDRARDAVNVGLRAEGGERSALITPGVIFYDPGVRGLQVHSIAQGGWTTADHLRVEGEGRGYSDEGLREHLRVFGFADAGVTPVVVIALGVNVAPGEAEDGATTAVYRENVRAIIARYRAALADIGAGEPWFLLVGMYSCSLPPPDRFALTRAARLWEICQSDARCGVVNLAALGGSRGGAFSSAWYFRQAEAAVTKAGSGGVMQLSSTGGLDGEVWVSEGPRWFLARPTAVTAAGLEGVPGAWKKGARVLSVAFDLHLSRAGADALAGLMWGEIERAARRCESDVNRDGVDGDEADVEAFFACLAGRCCDACSTDADGDGVEGTRGDVEGFLRAVVGEGC